jgi:uncharacterized protein YciI
MKYAAVIEYLQDKAKVQAVRPEHRQYLQGLREKGQLAIAGPFTDDWGGLIVYEAASAAQAEQLLKADPFFREGIFLKYVLRPWNPVMGEVVGGQ